MHSVNVSTCRDARALSLGRMGWQEALIVQRQIHQQRIAGACGDSLLLVEHPATYTTGSSFEPRHLVATPEQLAAEGAVLVGADRGGSITYHGPGQLVGYPILDLAARGRDLHRYLRDLEEVLIRALAAWGITGRREEGKTGVWAGDGKIASIGVRVGKWVSMHGFALNVATDLAAFERIVPCGLEDCRATSVHALSSARPTVWEAVPVVLDAFESVFGIRFVPQEN
jgi:lipoate-protein ligase B